jgi:hypothetical protein
VQKFLDGLNYNIGNALQLHQPRTVDAALSLAIMQEQLLEAATKRYSGRSRYTRPSSRVYTSPYKQAPVAGVLGSAPPDTQNTKPRWDEKVATLRAARRARDWNFYPFCCWLSFVERSQTSRLIILFFFLDALLGAFG